MSAHYAPFILGSYAAVAIMVVAMIAWIALDYRAQKARLRDLEAAGLMRRSAGRSDGP